MSFQLANNSYNASLTSDYGAGDGTLGVNSVPSNFPTIVTVARGTSKETRFYVTGGGSGLLTGVTRLDGANENISSGVSVECMIDAEFINQLASAIYTQTQLKDLTYAADGGATDAYAITLPVAPASFADITGLPISFKANTINTGAATLNVNGLGAKTIKKNFNQDLADGDLQAGQVVTVIYDGTNFQIQLATAVTVPTDGWIVASDAWVYVSANTFKIVGVDRTTLFTKGTRIKFTQTTAKYGVVIDSSFSTDTTVTIAINTDYVIANAAITLPYYSYQSNPQGYPTWFNFTPASITWDSTAPTTLATTVARFSVSGKMCSVQVSLLYTNAGTTNAALNFDGPIAAAQARGSKYFYPVNGFISDDGGGPVSFPCTGALYGTTPTFYINKLSGSISAKYGALFAQYEI